VHPMSQLAFDLDDVAPEPPPPADLPPEDVPDRDREAAVAKLASLIARYHAAEESPDDHE
jgi:hypothetical protein